MLLAIDVGNTRTKAGTWDGAAWVHHASCDTTQLRETADCNRFIESIGPASDCIFACVVDEVKVSLERAIEVLLGEPGLALSASLPICFASLYRTPDKLGADRMANVLGALALGSLPAIVVDLGTATKFDVIDRAGTHLGGAIMPGLEMASRALAFGTSKLPQIDLRSDPVSIGDDTAGSLLSGIVLGHACAIDGLSALYAQQVGKASTYLTGGAAKLVSRHLVSQHEVVEDLTILGLKEGWDRLQSNIQVRNQA